MAVADDLAQARAALTMVQAEPFNAEAPPEALAAAVTPTHLHYVRSNFALPVHDGRLEVTGAVDHPLTLTLDALRSMPTVTRVVTLECAGNGRLGQTPLPVGEPWGSYAVSASRWTGARLSEVLEQARPVDGGIDVRFEGADRGAFAPAARRGGLCFLFGCRDHGAPCPADDASILSRGASWLFAESRDDPFKSNHMIP